MPLLSSSCQRLTIANSSDEYLIGGGDYDEEDVVVATATTTSIGGRKTGPSKYHLSAHYSNNSNGPTNENYNCSPPPLFIISVTLLELGFFTYYTLFWSENNNLSTSGPLPIDSVFVYRPDRRGEIWRFVLYMFLHAGWVHLMFNLSIQLLVGLPLEMVHGSLRVTIIYMAGVLAGSLGTSVLDPNVYLVGASGGVYALLAAHLSNILLNYKHIEFGLLRLLSVVLIASVDVGFAVYDRVVGVALSSQDLEGDVLPSISYVAHFTGALAGLTLGLVVLKQFEERRVRDELLYWGGVGVYTSCMVFGVIYNLLHGGPS